MFSITAIFSKHLFFRSLFLNLFFLASLRSVHGEPLKALGNMDTAFAGMTTEYEPMMKEND